MIKYILLGILSVILFPSQGFSDPPMISANGFSCVKSQLLVTCQGQFPGLSGILSASGTYGVQLTYDTPVAPRSRYLFDSTTGCLIQISLSATGEATQALVKNAGGRSQTFPLPAQQAQVMSFCKS